MDCSRPGFPVYYQFPELVQANVHRVSDAIQPFHPRLPSSPLALNLSQHQGLFLWVGSSHQVAKVLELQLQHQSSQWIIYYSKLWIIAYSYWVLTSSKVLTHLKHIIQSSTNARDTGSIPGSGRFPWRKAGEVMEFHLSYFKSWKMMLWKCCTQYASTFGKLSNGNRSGKGQFSFQSQRKAMPKNAQTAAQLHSSHTLLQSMSDKVKIHE